MIIVFEMASYHNLELDEQLVDLVCFYCLFLYFFGCL